MLRFGLAARSTFRRGLATRKYAAGATVPSGGSPRLAVVPFLWHRNMSDDHSGHHTPTAVDSNSSNGNSSDSDQTLSPPPTPPKREEEVRPAKANTMQSESLDTAKVELSPASHANPLYQHSLTASLHDTQGVFLDFFRTSAPYIKAHQGSVVVVHLPGDLFVHPSLDSVMEDLALLRLIGVRLVLVAGSGYQTDKKLRSMGEAKHFAGGYPVVTQRMLQACMDAAGHTRFEIERKLMKGIKNSPINLDFNIVSGNFFTAQPIGVRDGVDLQYTGSMRRVHNDRIMERLLHGDVVVLTGLGYSVGGEIYKVPSEQVASATAASLKAQKLIFMASGQCWKNKETGNIIQAMYYPDAVKVLQWIKSGEAKERDGQVIPPDFLRYMEQSVGALRRGVSRAHLINRNLDGAMLVELFTRDELPGNTMISVDMYDGMRPASTSDIPGILDLIQPMEAQGNLVPRDRQDLEQEIGNFVVCSRDGLIMACANLTMFDQDYAEVGSVAVHPSYRKLGKGDSLLGYMERRALSQGAKHIFALSTTTMQWFMERGYRNVGIDDLPPTKRAKYNHKRNSKIYMKELKGTKNIDEDVFLRVPPSMHNASVGGGKR
eukprot:Clim_evm32s25 gene=Clim_evmTU32s25